MLLLEKGDQLSSHDVGRLRQHFPRDIEIAGTFGMSCKIMRDLPSGVGQLVEVFSLRQLTNHIQYIPLLLPNDVGGRNHADGLT